MIQCKNCGAQNPAGQAYCGSCGQPLNPATGVPTPQPPPGGSQWQQGVPQPYGPPVSYGGQPTYGPPQQQPIFPGAGPPGPLPPTYMPPGAYYAAPQPLLRPRKDPNTAMLLEFLGFFGLLGIGNIWAGKVAKGLLLLFGYWAGFVFVLIAPAVLGVLANAGDAVGVLTPCCFLLYYLLAPVGSGLWLRSELLHQQP